MFDIITFGSATSDIFLRLKKDNYSILPEKILTESRGICFPLGAKVFLEETITATGGGGTNTACTFGLQGFKTAFCGKVGDDLQGMTLIDDLKKNKVDVSFCQKDSQYPTAFSAILPIPGKERTVLIQRGACHFMGSGDIPWEKIKKTKWFYLAPLSGKLVEVFEPLVRFANENKIKVAVNPGDTQINLPENSLKCLLGQVDILILNREEASSLTKIPQQEEKEIIKSLASMTSGIIIITKGEEGSLVFDGKYLFEAGVLDGVGLIEKTGAGDAFASGFLSGLLQKNNIEYCMQLGTANATSCMQKIGAKNGLLKKGDRGEWSRVVVKKDIL